MCTIANKKVIWAVENSPVSPKFHMTGVLQKCFKIHIRGGPVGLIRFRAHISRAGASEQFTDINHLN